jgi:hypothetical protein
VGRVRVSRVIRARLGYFLGVLLVAGGLYLALGLGWALVALGAGVTAAFVWLYDVSEPSEAVVNRTDEGGWV